MIHLPTSPITWASFVGALITAVFQAFILKDLATAAQTLMLALGILGIGGAQASAAAKLVEVQADTAAVKADTKNIIENPIMPGVPMPTPPPLKLDPSWHR